MIEIKKIQNSNPIKIKLKNSFSKEYPDYIGKYIVVPLAYKEQRLNTKDKVMKENVIVKEVPFFEVSNSNGTTVFIGSEV